MVYKAQLFRQELNRKFSQDVAVKILRGVVHNINPMTDTSYIFRHFFSC